MTAHAFRDHLLATLYVAPDCIEPGRLIRFGKNKSCWCKLFDDCRGGVFGDWATSFHSHWLTDSKDNMAPQERLALARQINQASRDREREQCRRFLANGKRNAELMAAAHRVKTGDPVAKYLTQRKLPGAWKSTASCLRLHAGLPYVHEGEHVGNFPTMLAPLCTADGLMLSIHRTYLTEDGQKADVPTVKKLTPASGSLRGASIQIGCPVEGVLGVAEGIETALAASMASGIPVWSAYCANGLSTFVWPIGVRKLVIFGDADAAGRKATEDLRVRANRAGLQVATLIPRTEGMDWADVHATAEETL